MVHHIEEMDDLDGKTELLTDLAHQGTLDGLTELHTAPGELPAVALVPCTTSTEREKDFTLVIEYDRSGTDADVVYAVPHGG
jgi:hypothetical protein